MSLPRSTRPSLSTLLLAILFACPMRGVLAQGSDVEGSIAVVPVETLRLADFDPINPAVAPILFTVTIQNDLTARAIRVEVNVTAERAGALGSIMADLATVQPGAMVVLTNRQFDRYILADAASGVIDYATERGVLPADDYRFHLILTDPETGEVLFQDEDFVATSNDIAEVHALSPGNPLDQAP